MAAGSRDSRPRVQPAAHARFGPGNAATSGGEAMTANAGRVASQVDTRCGEQQGKDPEEIRNSFSTFTAADIKTFSSLRTPIDLITRAGVERVTNHDARAKYGIRSHGDLTGIVFPYFDPANGQRRTARLRRDNPEIENGRPKNKYISAFGDRRHLYFVPGCDELLLDIAVPVLLVEAEKSALALTAWAERTGRKILPVAMGGCWGWRGRIGKLENAQGHRVDEGGPLPDLQICNGREVFVLLDSNASTNANVQHARTALVRQLRSQGAVVQVRHLPASEGVNGPDTRSQPSGKPVRVGSGQGLSQKF